MSKILFRFCILPFCVLLGVTFCVSKAQQYFVRHRLLVLLARVACSYISLKPGFNIGLNRGLNVIISRGTSSMLGAALGEGAKERANL